MDNPNRLAPREPSLSPAKVALALTAGVLFAAFAGCSLLPGHQVVAKVAGHTLTLKAYETLLGEKSGGISPPDSIRRQMEVDNWVERTLLVSEALEQHLDTVPEVKSRLGSALDDALTDQLYRTLVTDKVKVSEPDVKALYERRKQSIMVAHILIKDAAKAEEVKRDLDKGTPFEQAALASSMDRATAVRGGIAGEVQAGQLPTDIEDATFRLKEGQVSAPIKTDGGFEIIKAVKITPRTPPPYEQAHVQLEQLLRQRQEYQLTSSVLKHLKDERHFKIEDSDVHSFVEKMRAAVMAGAGMPSFTPADLSAPLARFEGGPYTVGDLLRDLATLPAMYRPDFSDETAVKQFVDNRSAVKVLAAEGRARHLEKDPNVLQRFEAQRDNLLAQTLVGRLLGTQPPPTDAELQAEYDAHKGEFANTGQAEVGLISTPSQKDADEAAREARGNVAFDDLQRRYSKPTMEEASKPATWFFFDGSHAALEDSLRLRKQGDIVGPVAAQGRFYVYQVRGVYPGTSKSFEDARGVLMQRVRVVRQQNVLKQHLEVIKKKWPPTVNSQVMMKAKPAVPARGSRAAG